MDSSSEIKYRKMRAFVRWVFQTFVYSAMFCATLMVLIAFVDQRIESITIPEKRIPLMYVFTVLYVIIIRSFSLINSLEAIDKKASDTTTGRLVEKAEVCPPVAEGNSLQRIELANQKESDADFIRRRQYEHKKRRIIILYSCSGVAMFAGMTSMFFTFFVGDYAIIRSNPVPLLDQILIPTMLAAVIVFFHVKTASIGIESLEKKIFGSTEKNLNQTTAPIQSKENLAQYNFSADIVDKDGHLLVSTASFVRYCVQRRKFYPYTRGAWSPIDCALLNQKGIPITSKQLAQSYQDMMSKGTLPETEDR